MPRRPILINHRILELQMKKNLLVLLGIFAAMPAWSADLSVEARIEQAMMGEHRSETNVARNRYRHPVGTLQALGLKDGMTVMEIWPGAGWYTEILAPVMRHHGQLVVATWDVDVPDQPEYRYRLQMDLLDKFSADPEVYDQVAVVPFSPPQSASLGDADSVDMVLTFRNTHGWIGGGLAADVFTEFARVLKPGGILGVVQHRAANDSNPAETGSSGYVPEAAVIELARQAGLYLEAASEVNANPADTRDHANGVWSLLPGLSICRDMESEDEAEACRQKYSAIGESDRMTLRFRKPVR
jgi:predicted methyltransferase